jgi:uncharacterized membrane protein
LALVLGLAIFSIGLVMLIGASLPDEYEFSRSVNVSQPPDAVWRVLNDFPNEPSWRPELSAVKQLGPRRKHEAWREIYKEGESRTVEVAESVPGKRQQLVLTGDTGAFEGKWQFELTPNGASTRIVLHEEGSYTHPFTRFRQRFVTGQAAHAEATLRALATRLGEASPTVSR